MDSCCENMSDMQASEYSTDSFSCEGDSEESSQKVKKIQKISENECREVSLSPREDIFEFKQRKKTLKRWTAAEDKFLLEMFYKIGNNWEEIAAKLPGRAPSGVKNRFYWISKTTLPTNTVKKLKQANMVKKLYKNSKNSSELFRKINNYIRDECIFESFLALEKPAPYSDLVYKLKMTQQDLENHAKMQMLLEKAQQLYKTCEIAKNNLSGLLKTGTEQI